MVHIIPEGSEPFGENDAAKFGAVMVIRFGAGVGAVCAVATNTPSLKILIC
jgi:hypothetical protein